MLSVKRCIGKMCLERLRKSLTLTRHLSSQKKNKKSSLPQLSFGGQKRKARASQSEGAAGSNAQKWA